MKIGFTGTQHGMTEAQKATLHKLLSALKKIDEFHHGDCIGADSEAHAMVDSMNQSIVVHPPIKDYKRAFCTSDNMKTRTPDDYIKRNHDIVNETEMLIAVPNQTTEQLRSGTWATVRYARTLGRDIWIIYPNGSFYP